jgi:hypothetical protein
MLECGIFIVTLIIMMLSAIMLECGIFLVMLSVFMLNVIMLSVVVLSVVSPISNIIFYPIYMLIR